MNMRHKLLITSLLFVGCCVSSISISFAQVKPVQNSAQEIAVLQAQLKMMQAYQASLLSTVYWSLGVILTLTIVLVSYNWFVNNKMSERDKSALNQELRNLIDEITSQNQKKLEEIISNKFTHFEKEHQESIQNTLKEYISPLSSKINSINQQMPDIQYKQIQTEARYWEFRGVPGNELEEYLDLLPLAIKMKSDLNISEVLDKLLSFMKKGEFPFHIRNSDLIETLDSLPNKYSPEVQSIKELLSNNRKS